MDWRAFLAIRVGANKAKAREANFQSCTVVIFYLRPEDIPKRRKLKPEYCLSHFGYRHGCLESAITGKSHPGSFRG
ncbi:hypothetical protein TNCT_488451 [Trichonephila clavata]|uniref:Uncharacterized protein n=1 Tax=Trichonephila clavata TaxID=2740835 RepID=A0A8X6L028_TRICU|nr:hypothetical protein TNCT_488451 [Trichonephila clavata]